MATKKKTQRGSSRYLPADMISEILRRLPPKSLLRCRAICKVWRDLASDRKLLVDHHRRQPAQPLITLFHDVGADGFDADGNSSLPYNCLEAVDLTTDKPRRLARFIDRVDRGWDRNLDFDVYYALTVHGSCDGLVLLSFHGAFFVCNPATRQGTLLPPLQDDEDEDEDEVAGFYKHAASSEYRVLYHRDDGREREYYVLTVGSQQARSIGCMPSPVYVVEGVRRGLHGACVWPPVLLHGSLHWPPPQRHEGDILVFDIAAESFRWISPPAAVTSDFNRLFEMEGKLAMFYWKQLEWISDLWLMEDYEKAIWVCKYRIELSPIRVSRQIMWDPPIVYREGDMLLEGGWGFVLHYDKKGQVQGSFDCDVGSINITPHVFKESLVLHDFLQTQQNGVVAEPPFFEGS